MVWHFGWFKGFGFRVQGLGFKGFGLGLGVQGIGFMGSDWNQLLAYAT